MNLENIVNIGRKQMNLRHKRFCYLMNISVYMYIHRLKQSKISNNNKKHRYYHEKAEEFNRKALSFNKHISIYVYT